MPSIERHLTLRTHCRMVIHHRRAAEGAVDTRLVAKSGLTLDPSGIRLEVATLLGG